jgi:hypothetical protein
MTATIRHNQVGRFVSDVRQATARALTRSMETGRTQAVRNLAAELGTTQAAIRKRLVLTRATKDTLEAALKFTGKRLRLTEMGARQTRAGVTYRARGGRGLVKGAFLATLRSGHTGAFVRKTPTRSRAGRPRSSPALPIRELFGASVPYVATKQQILESTLQAAVAAFTKNQEHELGRAGRGSS